VILFDNAESDLYTLQQEIIAKKSNADFHAVVGDVTNKTTLRKVFKQYSPDIVYNAAAYKHVPLMEEFPGEAVRVNVGGTKNLADLSVEFRVKKFVLISTDKAVNPSNVMGATKRISEIYVQSLSQSGKFDTQFITTRFGNVLDSNGSVIPLFEKQIKMGGPLTVTHKDITRYFMTIPEAVQLVLEAGFMGKGGEIFVFDMGEPVKIYDRARKMISLSGFIPDKDIMIDITGLRPGEKLYEELLDNKEELLSTYNDKIMVAGVIKHEHGLVDLQVTELLNRAENSESNGLVEYMMNVIPEYVPLNSVYANSSVKKEPVRITPKISTVYHTN
jgi:FlaA1/EpsC-like NDP-sugar epimerase